LAALLALLILPAQASAHPSQLIVVTGHALRSYQRSGAYGPWRAVLAPAAAEVGYAGFSAASERHEGDGTTPTGVFAIGSTIYGVRPRPRGLHYRYHRLRCGDWWDEDPASADYNRFVHVRCGLTPTFAPGSEALWTEAVAYSYFAVIEFNSDPVVKGRGSGIFLHSWVGGPTDGCVAVHPAVLLAILRWLDPADHPEIEIRR
jgi:L,D-peptidoglycan transpeptidase YkuD (ErfK/YbiS/YcfS/YnhG family)